MDTSLRHPVIEVDLAIVGAGPAGSAAALRARALAPGLDVVLVDANDFPRDKVCGDGIGPEGLDVLARLDADDVVADAPRLDQIEVVAPSGRRARGRAPRAGVVVPRRRFDARLRDLAIGRGALPLRHRVRRVTRSGDRVVLDDVVAASWVVAADGANSAVTRSIGRPRPPRNRTGLAMRGYAEMPDLDALTIWFVADRWPAYAWAFPIGDGSANVGYGPFDATTISSRRDLEDSLAVLFGDVAVDPATRAAHHLPLSPARTTMGQGRVLVAGDAANLVHPLTGEGIYYALLSGAMAGAAVARHLAGIDCPELGPQEVYRRAMRARLGRHLRHTDLAAALLASSLPVEVAVAAAADDERALATLAEFALGTGRIDAAMVGAMTAAWWRHRPFDDLVRAPAAPLALPGDLRAPNRRGASRGP
ncbi:MAG TPA: geranylgeranyl reductase family protein [Nitriliruptoraceae bacterium]|nr:geranylgeranyl reductase family protein [Nitriliruptoraceae bacterium]